MNKIFKEDPTCLNREIYLKTFSVTPMTNRLGALEWVDNTEPLKTLINREHARLENGKSLNESRAQASLMKWLKNLPVNKTEQAQKSIMV
jgi:DNA-dependent protein kinase catalytic subunit